MFRALVTLVVIAALAAWPSRGFAQGTPTTDATPDAEGGTAAETFTIPGETVFPEGIATDEAAGVFYVGSTSDGTVYRGSLDTGTIEVFLPGGEDERTEVTGMKVDGEGRLVVAGRTTGQVFIYDTESAALLARYANEPGADTLVNDVAIDDAGNVYLTDSFRPVLYRLEAGSFPAAGGSAATPPAPAPPAPAPLPIFLDFTGTDFEYGDGFNANGLVVTPDGAYVLVVQFDTGQLFRVETATGGVAEVDLGDVRLATGDGLLLDGTRLFAVVEESASIVVLDLSDDFLTGSQSGEITDPSFDFPTTIARAGDRLLVVNSQLDMGGGGQGPDLPFTVSAVPIPSGDVGTPAA